MHGSVVLTFRFASQISKISYQIRYVIIFVAIVNRIFSPLCLPNDYWWYLVKLLIYIYLFCIVLLSNNNINEIISIADIY